MKPYEAKQIIESVFEKVFDKDQFQYFIKNFLKLKEFEGQHIFRQIPSAFENVIEKYERVTKFKDAEGNLVDVLIVELKRAHCVEYARSSQRNFIRRYLNGLMGGELKDAALVAFFSPSSPEEWRFSLIKMQYSLEKKQDDYTPAKRFSFRVGERRKSHTAKQQLVGILKKEDQPTLSDLETAFNIETVTNEFFEAYKKLVIDVTEELVKIRKKDNKVDNEFNNKNIDNLDFAKKLLGQIVFICFLQKKGWLGLANGQKYGEGDQNFLRNLFHKKAKGENFFNDYLEWLFYDALSRKRVTDFYPRFGCRIPFLNGGLFDPIHFYDWEKTDIKIADELFTNHKPSNEDIGTGILDVFDRYNFTVQEDEPLEKEVAVDPEMLGKVFERMLDVKERKSKGAFYTPREIVHYMSQESLIQYLDTALNDQPQSFQRLGDDQTKIFGNETKKSQSDLLIENKGGVRVPKADIEKFIKHGEIIIETDVAVQQGKLSEKSNKFEIPESIRKNVQLIDEKLTDIRVCDPAVGSGAFPVGVMHEIVKARSTLARMLNPDQEPNVYGFKQHAIHHCLYGVDIDASAVEICKLRLWLSLVVNETRIDVIEPLPNLDFKIVRGNSLIGLPDGIVLDIALKEEIDRLKNKYYSETDKEEKKDLKRNIDDKINKMLRAAEPYVGHSIDFDFKLYFHEVFDGKKGFDIVIGNPPYIQLQKALPDDENLKYADLYKNLNYQTFERTGDIYCLFYERGLQLLKSHGNLNFITSNKWMRANYGRSLRNLFLRYKPLNLIDLGPAIFKAAIVDTNILLIQNRKADSHELKAKGLYISKNFKTDIAGEFKAIYLSKDEIWNILDPIQLKIKNRIYQKGKPLKEWNLKINRGIVTGFNEAFIISQKTRDELIAKDPKSDEIIKPILRGKDINRFKASWANTYLIFIPWHFPLHEDNTIIGASKRAEATFRQKYPTIYNHLLKYKKSLINRNKEETGIRYEWYALQRCAATYLDEFRKEKVVWKRIGSIMRFSYSNIEEYCLDSTCIATGEKIKYLAAVLNSLLCLYELFRISPKTGTGDQIISVQALEPLRVYYPSEHEQKIIEQIADYIIFLRTFPNESNKAKYEYFEHLIDGMVFELYFEEEIKRAGRDILKYLTNLTPITDDMSDEQKLDIITRTYHELSDPNHPVRQNLDGMDEIEEVRIVKGIDQ